MNDCGAERIRVLIVDDHPVVREGLCAVLRARHDMDVVGEAQDGAQAIECFKTLRPDVMLIDLRLPGVDGLSAIRAIRQLDPQARLIALTSYEGDVDVRSALAAGAGRFLLKKAPIAELVEAIHQVGAGQQWISKEIRALLTKAPTRNLTHRELDVLGLLAQGSRNQQIAEALNMSLRTVKCHVEAVLDKLGAVDRTEAAITALKRGLIHLP